MKRILSLLAIAFMGLQLNAQDASIKETQSSASKSVTADAEKKPTKNGWIRGASFNFSLTQIGNSNWIAAGGDDFSLSSTASISAYANRKWKRNTWENMIDLNYALVNTTTLGTRKVNDRLDIVSKYGYKCPDYNT